MRSFRFVGCGESPTLYCTIKYFPPKEKSEKYSCFSGKFFATARQEPRPLRAFFPGTPQACRFPCFFDGALRPFSAAAGCTIRNKQEKPVTEVPERVTGSRQAAPARRLFAKIPPDGARFRGILAKSPQAVRVFEGVLQRSLRTVCVFRKFPPRPQKKRVMPRQGTGILFLSQTAGSPGGKEAFMQRTRRFLCKRKK